MRLGDWTGSHPHRTLTVHSIAPTSAGPRQLSIDRQAKSQHLWANLDFLQKKKAEDRRAEEERTHGTLVEWESGKWAWRKRVSVSLFLACISVFISTPDSDSVLQYVCISIPFHHKLLLVQPRHPTSFGSFPYHPLVYSLLVTRLPVYSL